MRGGLGKGGAERTANFEPPSSPARPPPHFPRRADYVREEIEAETARSLGTGKAVSAEPIMLTVRSPLVPNLTLVDMVRPARHPRTRARFSRARAAALTPPPPSLPARSPA